MAKKRRRRKSYTKKNFFKKRKRVRRDSRDYKSPEYTNWRNTIKERDDYTCQWPGCLSRKQIQVHHIKTWAKYPGMRFVTANGITLCRKCHDSIKGKEVELEPFFLKLLEWQMLSKIKEYSNKKKRRKK